jgi:glycosyltransferase involved in cell wall biosynthesis
MRISILLPDLRYGGVERVRVKLAYEFKKLGHDVEFVLMQKRGELLQEVVASFKIVDLNVTRVRNMPHALIRYLNNNCPDSLLVAMWPITTMAAICAKLSKCDCHVLLSEHCQLSSQYRVKGILHWITMRASMAVGYRLAHARVGVSSGVAADSSKLAYMKANGFQVIYNPLLYENKIVDTSNVDAHNTWGVNRGARILTVGRFKSQKNQTLLINAFAKIKSISNAKLMLIGNGNDADKLQELVAKLGISDQVEFLGYQNDPTPFYATADLFVLSSDYEGFANVIVEALSFGLPVVSTDCPSGPSEILENGRYGRLVPVGDVDALAQAIEETLNTPVDKEALIRRAADFSPEIAARKYLDLLGLS